MQYFSIITLWKRKNTREGIILKAVAKKSQNVDKFHQNSERSLHSMYANTLQHPFSAFLSPIYSNRVELNVG